MLFAVVVCCCELKPYLSWKLMSNLGLAIRGCGIHMQNNLEPNTYQKQKKPGGNAIK